MPVYNASKRFATPKKRGRPAKTAKKSRACAPKLPYSVCTNAEKNWVHGEKRQFCRTKKNKRS